MDRKMPPESFPSPEYPHRLAYAREFRVKARQRSPGRREKNTKITSNRDRKATTATSIGEGGTGMEGPNAPDLNLKFQNFLDNVSSGGIPK